MAKSRPSCETSSCDRPIYGLGPLCKRCYWRHRNHGTTDLAEIKRRSHRARIVERLWASFERADSHWLWTRRLRPDGYANFVIHGRKFFAHRVMYELIVGPIPDGLDLDHLCRVRHCINPAHLEPVTHTENVRRGAGPPSVNRVKTHCPQGHPYDEANTRWYRGRRYCKACGAESSKRRKAAARSAPAAA